MICVSCVLCVLAPLVVQAQDSFPPFPGNQVVPGWDKAGSERTFYKNDLYGFIDGGSELFLEMGFEVLKVQKYLNAQKDEMAVEIYRMDSPEAALGIYLLNCGEETPLPDFQERHSADYYQLTVIKGQYFIKVNNFSGKPTLLPALVQLARATLATIPAQVPADLFVILPVENRIKGTELLIRGQYTLQSIFTLGEGDILLLNNTIFGVSAQYQDEQQNTFTRIMVRYPDPVRAQQAFLNIKSHLDSYIQVVESGYQFIRFKDFQNKIGLIQIEGDMVRITVHLIK